MDIDENWRPSFAYVPGQMPRHIEDLFDPIKASIHGAIFSDLHQTSAWRMAGSFLDEGFYWEAHEIYEAIWLACPPNSRERFLVQGLIQRANAKLKKMMDQDNAYRRLQAESDRLIAEAFLNNSDPILGCSSSNF